MAELEGGCACGAVRYRLASAPMFVNCCHCTECQRLTGTAFAVNAIIEADRVELLAGTPEDVDAPPASGTPHPISRCPTCRTPLWSVYGGRAEFRFVCVGALDDPGALTPGAHIFTRSKLPWVALSPKIPAFEVYYDTKTLWPAESLARRASAMG